MRLYHSISPVVGYVLLYIIYVYIVHIYPPLCQYKSPLSDETIFVNQIHHVCRKVPCFPTLVTSNHNGLDHLGSSQNNVPPNSHGCLFEAAILAQNPIFGQTQISYVSSYTPFLPIKSPHTMLAVSTSNLFIYFLFQIPQFVGPCPCDIPLSLLGPLVTRMAPANNSGTPASAGSSCQSQDQDPQLAMDQVSPVPISNNEVFIQYSFNIQNCFCHI